MDISLLQECCALVSEEDKVLQFKKCVWALLVEVFKRKLSKEFWLRKAFNFFKNVY